MVLFKRNKIIDVFCFFPVCIKNQIIRINNQKRELISAFTLKHFLPLHPFSVTAGSNSYCPGREVLWSLTYKPKNRKPSLTLFSSCDSGGAVGGGLFLPICTVALMCVSVSMVMSSGV